VESMSFARNTASREVIAIEQQAIAFAKIEFKKTRLDAKGRLFDASETLFVGKRAGKLAGGKPSACTRWPESRRAHAWPSQVQSET
jgi:hypothetical protein